MKKRILALLLCLCMAAGMLPGRARAADAGGAAPCASLTINGVTLNAENPYYKNGDTAKTRTGSEADWNAKFEPAAEGQAASTLTLKDLNVESGSVFFPSGGDLNLVLTGESTVNGSFYTQEDHSAAFSTQHRRGDLTVSGDGSLTLSGGQYTVVCGKLVMNGGSLKGMGTTSSSSASNGIYAREIEVTGGTLAGEGNMAGIVAEESLTVSGGKVTSMVTGNGGAQYYYGGLLVGFQCDGAQIKPDSVFTVTGEGEVTCGYAGGGREGLHAGIISVSGNGKLHCNQGDILLANLTVTGNGAVDCADDISTQGNVTVEGTGSVSSGAVIEIRGDLSVAGGTVCGKPVAVEENLILTGGTIESIGGNKGMRVAKTCRVEGGLLKGTGGEYGILVGGTFTVSGGEVLGICSSDPTEYSATAAIYSGDGSGSDGDEGGFAFSGGVITAKSEKEGIPAIDFGTLSSGIGITADPCSYTTTEGGTLMQGKYVQCRNDRYVRIDCTQGGASRPKVTSIAITPNGGKVYMGHTQQFTATVAGDEAAGDKVNWSIVSPWMGSAIDADGLLTVGESEYSTLTIRATHDIDREKYAEVVVAVEEPRPTVEKVTVTPATAAIKKGGSADFTAEVEGLFLDASAEKMEWSLVDGEGDNIAASGLTLKNENNAPSCTVEVSESYTGPTSFWVKATSRNNYEKSATAAVTVSDSHDPVWSETWSSDETSHWHVCTKCAETTAPEAHEFGEWITDREATAEEAGSKHRVCGTCQYRQEGTIPATGGDPSAPTHTFTASRDQFNPPGGTTVLTYKETDSAKFAANKNKIALVCDREDITIGAPVIGTDTVTWTVTVPANREPYAQNYQMIFQMEVDGENQRIDDTIVVSVVAVDAYIYVPVESVAVSPKTASVAVGDTVTLSKTVSPIDIHRYYPVWSSSDETVAAVSEDGVVTGVKAGTAVITITVSTADNRATVTKSDTCTVTVTSGTGGDTPVNPPVVPDVPVIPPYTGGSTGGTTTSKPNTTKPSEDKKDDSAAPVTSTTTDETTGAVTETTVNPDGSSVATTTAKDGTIATVTTTASGQTETAVALSATSVAAAQTSGEAVSLPIQPVRAAQTMAAAPVISVTTASAQPVKVEIPAVNPTPGTVAVLVKADGTEEVIKTSVATADGVAAALPDGAKVKIVDNAKTFADTQTHWAGDAVAFVTARELFDGTTETDFAPERPMTRAMLVTVLARLDGADTAGGETWYSKGVDWAVSKNISDGSDPEENISREQLAVMLWRYAGSPASEGALTGFADGEAVSDYAQAAMAWAVASGVINGSGDKLDPQGEATRAQVAQMLKNFIEKA